MVLTHFDELTGEHASWIARTEHAKEKRDTLDTRYRALELAAVIHDGNLTVVGRAVWSLNDQVAANENRADRS